MAAAAAPAQSGGGLSPDAVRMADLELSGATISQAGPDSFYVRGVGIGGNTYSILLDQSAAGSWSVRTIVPEELNILPASAVLDFATLRVAGDATIEIDGVIVDGVFYRGSLVASEESLDLVERIYASRTGEINDARADAVGALLTARSREEFDALLAEQRDRLEVVIRRIEAQRDSFRVERDRLAAENAALADERAELAERLRETADASDPSVGPTPLSAAQINALLRERDLLATDVVGLVQENNELRDERRTLRDQIELLRGENDTLRDDIATMTSEVDRLEELVRTYRETVGELPAVGARADRSNLPEWQFPGDYVRRSDLEAAAAHVNRELAALSNRVSALEVAATGLADLEQELRTGVLRGLPAVPLAADSADRTGALAATRADATRADATREDATREDAQDAVARAEQADRLARIVAELADLEAEMAELRAEKQTLEQRVLSEILNNGLVQLMRAQLTRQTVAGFTSFKADTGAWTVTPARATQTDRSAFFAKLSRTLPQAEHPTLYSFTARSLDDGWVGLGLHLFVDDVRLRRGYGMGSGLLVWITRDPRARRTQDSFLELYRSDDDVAMGRVLDAAIPEAVGDSLRIDVLYEPHSQYITIAINGEDKVRYRTWFGIDSGMEIALRSLGRAEFTDFSVRTMP
ncbi:MAG: hypothetical protein EA382_11390 [Spirochaetaceae bacterium]|nr:MAG: hypothetical protein EA382_11390 [Spirochaetaceae bacterium]